MNNVLVVIVITTIFFALLVLWLMYQDRQAGIRMQRVRGRE